MPFAWQPLQKCAYEKNLKSANICEAGGLDKFLGCFLKDGLHVLSISNLWNLFVILGSFSASCKIP